MSKIQATHACFPPYDLVFFYTDFENGNQIAKYFVWLGSCIIAFPAPDRYTSSKNL